MTSRIQGWSNRQKDTGWGYAFAHYIPGVGIYYSITRRTISNFSIVLGAQLLIRLIVVYIATDELYFPSLFDEPPVDQDTSDLILFFDLLLTPLFAKLAISTARDDGKNRLRKIEEEKEEKERLGNLNKMKEEVEQLRGELENLKDEKGSEKIKRSIKKLKDEKGTETIKRAIKKLKDENK